MEIYIGIENIYDCELSFIDGYLSCIEVKIKDEFGNVRDKIEYVDETYWFEDREPDFTAERTTSGGSIPEDKKRCDVRDIVRLF